MKRTLIAIIVIVILIILIAVLLFNSSEEEVANTEVTEINDETKTEEDVYYFEDGDYTIYLGAEYTSLDLGEPVSYYEAQSCAFDGMDKSYTFEHYEISTYPESDIDEVLSIYFLDDQVSTTEGIKIGDSYDDMIETYGEDFEQLETQYTYSKGLTQLIFIVQDDVITSIEYNYDI